MDEKPPDGGGRAVKMEGVARYKVKLLPHNPAWEEEYIQVKKQIENCWGSNVADIQHVGSTAIKDICAKPILDVAVRLKSIHEMDVEALEKLGYSYRGARNGNDKYHLFVLRGQDDISLRHIHCYDATEKEFGRLTGFRDYLNSHREAALQYESLKKTLAEENREDRAAYTAGKEAFIQSIYAKLEENH